MNDFRRGVLSANDAAKQVIAFAMQNLDKVQSLYLGSRQYDLLSLGIPVEVSKVRFPRKERTIHR